MSDLPQELQHIRVDLNERFARWDARMQRLRTATASALTLIVALLVVAATFHFVTVPKMHAFDRHMQEVAVRW